MVHAFLLFMASSTATPGELSAQRAAKELAVFGTLSRHLPEDLDAREIWWRDRYTQLLALGYLLRPRYSPEWIPSWKTSRKSWLHCEDGKRLEFGQIIDATRISDSRVVTLKQINQTIHPYEVEIGQYFSSEPLASQSANHCVPIYDVLSLSGDDDVVLAVMPLLRSYTDPHFDTIGEGVECFRQLFEGLQFMHQHHVAHRDCMKRNIMLDPIKLYPLSFHPVETALNRECSGYAQHFTRTQKPPKYYFIDFGLSRRYDPSNTNPREVPIWGGDKEVPEFQNSNEPRDPFATDIFYIGNAIRKDFILAKRGFEFMESLVADMIQADPAKRPTVDEVVSRFHVLHRGLNGRKLRARPVGVEEDLFDRISRTASHWKRRMVFVARRISPVPRPPDT